MFGSGLTRTQEKTAQTHNVWWPLEKWNTSFTCGLTGVCLEKRAHASRDVMVATLFPQHVYVWHCFSRKLLDHLIRCWEKVSILRPSQEEDLKSTSIPCGCRVLEKDRNTSVGVLNLFPSIVWSKWSRITLSLVIMMIFIHDIFHTGKTVIVWDTVTGPKVIVSLETQGSECSLHCMSQSTLNVWIWPFTDCLWSLSFHPQFFV